MFTTTPLTRPIYVIKVLNTDREELAIYKRLLSGDMKRSNNHTIPCELTRTGHPLLIMPLIYGIIWIYKGHWSPRDAMDVILQFVEVRHATAPIATCLSLTVLTRA